MAQFEVIEDPTAEQLKIASDLEPANPFSTIGYCAARRDVGDACLLLIVKVDGQPVTACTAFYPDVRFAGRITIPSAPRCEQYHEFFVQNLLNFSKRKGFRNLSLCSFASFPDSVSLAHLPRSVTVTRREYVLPLCDELTFGRMRKGHAYSIKKGIKAGLVISESRCSEALDSHINLMNESAQRRNNKGERIDEVSRRQRRLYQAFLDNGAGRLFQAVKDNQILSSNLLLFAETSAYNQTQGTSDLGNSHGAAHFLIYAIARELATDSKMSFNLGGTREIGGGLERFKTGFSRDTQILETSFSEMRLQSKWLSVVRSIILKGH